VRCGGDASGFKWGGLGRGHVYEQLEYKKEFSLSRKDNNKIAPEAFSLSFVHQMFRVANLNNKVG
jgi:hypothetical protein